MRTADDPEMNAEDGQGDRMAHESRAHKERPGQKFPIVDALTSADADGKHGTDEGAKPAHT